jgi:Ca-activated chloride channel homolog
VVAAALSLSATPAECQSVHLRGGVELVGLTVTVRDRGGRAASALRREDFELYENGRAQKITLCERDRLPMILTVLIDSSRSMASRLPAAKFVISDVLHVLQPGDVAALVDSSGSIRHTLTSDIGALRAALMDLAAGGTTSLYDSMSIAAELMSSHADPIGRAPYRRVLLVVSDGVDTASTEPVDAVVARMRSTATTVYAVRPPRRPGDLPGRTARNLEREHVSTLKRMTVATGGELFVDIDPHENTSVIEARLSRDSSTYLLGYSPVTPAAPEAHVTVRLKRRDLTVVATRFRWPASLGASD